MTLWHYFGHDAVAILDGGASVWMQSGHKVKFGRAKNRRGDFAAGLGRTEMVATLADVKVISELLGNPEVRLYDGSMQGWTMEKMPVTALKRD